MEADVREARQVCPPDRRRTFRGGVSLEETKPADPSDRKRSSDYHGGRVAQASESEEGTSEAELVAAEIETRT